MGQMIVRVKVVELAIFSVFPQEYWLSLQADYMDYGFTGMSVWPMEPFLNFNCHFCMRW